MGGSRRTIALAIFAALAAFPSQALAQQPVPLAEAPEDFPDQPGRDATFYFCTACHGFKLVAAQAMNREQWEGVLILMVQKHAMPKVEGAARAALLDYLAAAFPPRQQVPGRQSPFAPR